ncbi:hypothetical protein OUZ56_025530 [Daphnia magna]|uniref:Uncharacterized protein n=1 Tax=Daphnia magna TaxID=35525 RepID=A0ABQ9ZK44_9CRUS|nr:hypothetical protein OUZ56_025530 [Daphnia magna]
MSEAVAKAESMESNSNISIEDEMKPEAVNNEGPLLPDNDLKQKRGRRKVNRTKLTNQFRKAVADHKMGPIRLKKLQFAACLPDITDPQRQAREKWENVKNQTIRHQPRGNP